MSIYRFLASDAQADRGRRLRRRFPIQMYVGRNGMGKSLTMIYDTLPDLEVGRPVLSTVRLLDYKDPRPCELNDCPEPDQHELGHLHPHPSYIRFHEWPQLLEFREGVVLMDEVTGVADSSEASGLPAQVTNMLAQMRRGKISVRLTGLNWIRAHKRIREATLAVTRCEGFMPVDERDDNGEDAIWRARRLIVARTYDARSLPIDDHTESAYEAGDMFFKARMWVPTLPAIGAYDTNAPVNIIGSVSDAGRCAHCEGKRQIPECVCPDYQQRKDLVRVSRAQVRSAEHGVTRSGPFDLAPGRASRAAS